MDTTRVFRVVIWSMCSFCWLFAVLSLSLTQWQHQNTARSQASMGIWKMCTTDKCESVPDVGSIEAVRAMMFLGFFSMLATKSCLILSTFILRNNSIMELLVIALSAISGLFLMCGFSVFADQVKIEEMVYGSCFYLAIIAWLLAWGVTVLQSYKYFAKSSTDEERRPFLAEEATNRQGSYSGAYSEA